MTAQANEIFLDIPTPRWAVPLLAPKRLKGAKGGRSSGKSHFYAEAMVERLFMEGNTQAVCIREVQKSLKFSAKKLIENKIRKLKLSHLFEITINEIRRLGRDPATGEAYVGIIIFQGMQDHTAESIKSLEDFDLAWCEEAQSLSAFSLELLEPTIRKDGSEIWFSWNPSKETDAVEKLFDESDDEDSVLVHVNYTDNPYCPDVMKRLAEKTRKRNFEKYNHVWLGGFNTRSEAMVFDHWRVDDFTPLKTWDGPYYGMDFGFSNDPSCFVRCYINDNTLYIDQDAGKVKLELDDTAAYFIKADPEVARHAMRADSARPESISYLKRNGLPRIVGVKKGAGSVEDGVEHINTYDEIVIHTRCEDMAAEAQDYSFKVNKGGDVTTDIVDADNHRWDAVRYALQPLIKKVNLIFEAL